MARGLEQRSHLTLIHGGRSSEAPIVSPKPSRGIIFQFPVKGDGEPTVLPEPASEKTIRHRAAGVLGALVGNREIECVAPPPHRKPPGWESWFPDEKMGDGEIVIDKGEVRLMVDDGQNFALFVLGESGFRYDTTNGPTGKDEGSEQHAMAFMQAILDCSYPRLPNLTA